MAIEKKELPMVEPLLTEKVTQKGFIAKILTQEKTEDPKFLKDYETNDPGIIKQYKYLNVRDRKLIDDVSLAVPYSTIFDEYFREREKNVFLRAYHLDKDKADGADISALSKKKILLQVINRKGLGKFITARRKEISDIYLEEFRKKAVDTFISKEFIKNELVKLREKVKDLDVEKQIIYELKILNQIDKAIVTDPSSSKGNVTTNIQINTNLPDWEK